MSYVDGVDLHTLASATGGLSAKRAVLIVSQVAAALDAIHARGLVHRDVKPGNTLIAEVDGADHAYLCDFGLAAAFSRSSRGSLAGGEFVGTFGYVAPEQLRGGHISRRADVYGLGCLLFEAVAGRAPFYGLTDAAKVEAQLTGPRPRLAALGIEVPPGVDEVIARALDPEPKRRFASAGELAAAVLVAARPVARVARSQPHERTGTSDHPKTALIEPDGETKRSTERSERDRGGPGVAAELPMPPTPTVGRSTKFERCVGCSSAAKLAWSLSPAPAVSVRRGSRSPSATR